MPHQWIDDSTPAQRNGEDGYLLPSGQFVTAQLFRSMQQSLPCQQKPRRPKSNPSQAKKGAIPTAYIPEKKFGHDQGWDSDRKGDAAKCQLMTTMATAAKASRIQTRAWASSCQPAMSDQDGASSAVLEPTTNAPRPDVFFGSYDAPAQSSSASEPSQTHQSMGIVREAVEQVVEQQMADALGPLRLNINNFTDTVASLRNEKTDFHEQNDVFSRQIDLHYRDIQQLSELAHSHARAFASMMETHSKNNQSMGESLAAANTMIGQLAQIVLGLAPPLDRAADGGTAAESSQGEDQPHAAGDEPGCQCACQCQPMGRPGNEGGSPRPEQGEENSEEGERSGRAKDQGKLGALIRKVLPPRRGEKQARTREG